MIAGTAYWEPRYIGTIEDTAEDVYGFVIAVSGTRDHMGREPRKSLKFGSLRDAELAIAALLKHGITSKEDVLSRDRSEVVKICCEALLW